MGRRIAARIAFAGMYLMALGVSGASFPLTTAPTFGATSPQPEPTEEQDWKSWLDKRAVDFSGVALIGRGDSIQVLYASGLADRSSGEKNAADTRFNLGSVNKTFTAVAIAQLVQESRLSLDDRLAKYLPDYPNHDAATKITIRDLIAHRSGVAQFMRADFGDKSVAEMARRVGAEPQVFEPGTRQEYSNGGYILLGRVIEVVSGKSYSAYVSERIYQPAGMTQTGFFNQAESRAPFARGYFSADSQGRPMMGSKTIASNPLEVGNPAGGGYSTAADLFKFARALKAGRLLNARMTDYVLNGTFSAEAGQKFGFALREQIIGTRRFIGNGGGAPGVNAEFRFEPAGDYTVVVLANVSPPAATQLLSDILTRLAGAAPSGAEPPSNRGESDSIRREIEALHAEMVAAFRENPGNVARYYTSDARILGGGRRFSGAEIASYWSQGAGAASWKLDIIDVGGSRDEPWILGKSTLMRQDGRSMVTDFLAILRRGSDAKLKYRVDMFTAAVRSVD